MAADEILRARQLVSGRRWLPPGPAQLWHEELDDLYVRGHQVDGAIGALRDTLLKHRSSTADKDALAAASVVYNGAISDQLGSMRVHLVRATTIAGAHAAIIATTYAKPVCDLMAEHYNQVTYHPEDYDKYLEGFGKCTDALEALYEILVPLFVKAGQKPPVDQRSLSNFRLDQVQQVREAIRLHGANAKYEQLLSASRPIRAVTFDKLLKLLREEEAS